MKSSSWEGCLWCLTERKAQMGLVCWEARAWAAGSECSRRRECA